MKKMVLPFLVGLICISIVACNGKKDSAPITEKKNDIKANSAVDGPVSKTPMADAVKRKKLPDFSQKTIGEAFDGYTKAVSREWQETAVNGNKYIVDYTAWYQPASVPIALQKEGFVKVGVIVKFTVQNTGDFYVTMISSVQMKSDNIAIAEPLEPAEAKAALSAIYDNTEFLKK